MQTYYIIETIESTLKDFIEKKYPQTGIAKVIIRKTQKECELIIFTSKVWVLMGKQWANIKDLETELERKFHKKFKVNVKEVKVPEFSAKVMAEFISNQLENRMPYRKVAKNVLQKVMQKWANWIKISVGWRLNWAEIARAEKFIDGRVSLQTFRSDIDYHYMQAMTKYGVLWVKVWIEKWTLYNKKKAPKKSISL